MGFRIVVVAILFAFYLLAVNSRLLLHEQMLNTKIFVQEDVFVKYDIINIGSEECANVTLKIDYNETQIKIHRRKLAIYFAQILEYSNVSYVISFLPKTKNLIKLDAKIEYTYQNKTRNGFALSNEILVAIHDEFFSRRKILNTSTQFFFFTACILTFAIPSVFCFLQRP